MFQNMSNQQAVADGLKAEVHRLTFTPAQRQSHKNAVKRINQFEAARWNPIAFQTALDAVKGLTAAMRERGGVQFNWDGTGQIGPAVHQLFDTYYQVLGEPEVVID